MKKEQTAAMNSNSQQGILEACVGIVGAGAMGIGIAQVAATAGHQVLLYDNNSEALEKTKANFLGRLLMLVEKQKLTKTMANAIVSNIKFVSEKSSFKKCFLLIEAIAEDLKMKQELFVELESLVAPECVLASNTSSLSITAIASACSKPERLIGIHFFNPAPIMSLVEIIPGLATDTTVTEFAKKLMEVWGKDTVLAKDSPGFIVNRLARSYYGESLRIHEEGIADFATIDRAMKTMGGFKMGPFELMDFIGIDVNYKVTESVWTQFYFEPRFKPSLIQKKYVDAQWFGRKTGKGFYDYSEEAVKPTPIENVELSMLIFNRVIAMLINEAVDALYLKLATKTDLDAAMIKGVNFPKGLLRWADDIGLAKINTILQNLKDIYGEERYRPCILLKSMAKNNEKFYP